MRRFEFVEGKSSKFWQIALEGTSFTVQYGRLGTDGQTQVKDWPTVDKARAEHDKLVKEKTGKGYVEVTNGAGEAPSDDTPKPAAVPRKPAPKKEPVEVASTDGWLDAGGGYGLGIRDDTIVARNDKGKVLASVPKQLKDGEAWEMLSGAAEFLTLHAVECKETIETWMLRSLPVPRGVLTAIWADPAWRRPLENLIVEADGIVGILRAIEEKGLGVVNLDGETKWLPASGKGPLSVPHPILLGDLDDWRSLLAELAIAQGTAQLFRETFPKPADQAGNAITEFQNGEFDLLAQANNEARKLGYRVSGGCAVCRVWENGGLVEARYYIGDGDPMYETSTGDLSWVDARQSGLTIAQVGAVAFSEGMRMASAIYAKRKIAKEGEDEDV
jgi:predicted DNA-binding WGR domain protein